MAQEPEQEGPVDESAEDEANRLAAYDLDGDGHIGAVDDARAQLGVLDAKLEEVAEEGGVKGKIAGAAHRIVDKLDND